MNKNSRIDHMEYLSLALVISFFFIHNIYMVMMGVSLAIYTINKSFFTNLIKANKNKTSNEDIENFEDIKIDTSSQIESTKSVLAKEGNMISLVETIEESGFIPSLEKDDTSNAA